MATGGAAATGGSSAAGGCDFTRATCQTQSAVCSSVQTWEQTACTGLLACLETNFTCITAADPLCSTKGSFGNPECTDLYSISAASQVIIANYVSCACAL